MKVSKVYPGGPAEKAGLKPGDLIRSVNGYLTVKPGNLTWIIANRAPGKVLKIIVHAAPDGNEQTVTVQLP
jgi:S1-C subfamily serine protease